MRVKVELHKDVVRYVRRSCNDDEVAAFYEQLERLRTDPIDDSEPTTDPRLSKYMLRFFRIGNNLAIFEYDPARNRIRVLECRRIPARRARRENAADPP